MLSLQAATMPNSVQPTSDDDSSKHSTGFDLQGLTGKRGDGKLINQ